MSFCGFLASDDPGDEFAHRCVGIRVSATGYGHRRSHLGVAESRERACDSAEDEREHDRRTHIVRSRRTGQHEDARADDRTDTERREVHRGERPLEMMLAARFNFGFQRRDGFSCKEVGH